MLVAVEAVWCCCAPIAFRYLHGTNTTIITINATNVSSPLLSLYRPRSDGRRTSPLASHRASSIPGGGKCPSPTTCVHSKSNQSPYRSLSLSYLTASFGISTVRRPSGGILVNIQVKRRRSMITYVDRYRYFVCLVQCALPSTSLVLSLRAYVCVCVCCPRHGETVCCFRSFGIARIDECTAK